jgi:hypothetical protein
MHGKTLAALFIIEQQGGYYDVGFFCGLQRVLEICLFTISSTSLCSGGFVHPAATLVVAQRHETKCDEFVPVYKDAH